MSINPIQKIIYHTPNTQSQAGLSETLDYLSDQIKDKFGKDKIEVVTNATSAKIEVIFKNGIVREFSLKYGRLLKHILENNISEDDNQGLSTLYI